MRERFFVIHNPRSGQRSRRFYAAVLSRLREAGACVETVETERHGEGKTTAAAMARSGRFDAILAAGGDGTIQDVAEGLLGFQTPLGIIAVGTANVFARELGLLSSPDVVAATLLEGDVHAVPVGQVNGRPFLFVVGVGFDAEAVRHFETSGKRSLGRAGLMEPVLRSLVSHRDLDLRVKTENGVTHAQWVIVTRTKRYAAGLLLAPEADLRVPLFHTLSMKGRGPFARVIELSMLAAGRLRFAPGAKLEASSWVTIDGDQNVPVQIDGEFLGHLPLKIGSYPAPMHVILPRELVVHDLQEV